MSMSELLRPLEYASHKWRVMNITKNKDKASLAFYIDARDVMDRLDAVVGGENWQDKYTVLAYSDSRWAVECTLVVNGVAKTDVGEGDAPKDAYSDALKRAAVKFGIGRYLYDMDTGTWFPIDSYGKFTPEAEKQIENLLRQNMARLGVKPAQSTRKEPATTTTTPPAGAATNGTTTGIATTNGSTNGHGGALWQTWESPAMAKAWAVECGACKNEYEAGNSFAKLVKDNFGGRLNAENVKDVYAAYYGHQMDKLHAQAEAAVSSAPEMVPA